MISTITAACLVAFAAATGCTSEPATPGNDASPTVSSPSRSSVASGPSMVPASARWWDERTFYEIFVRSFQDSDGDGIGDLRGVIDRLDYLNDGDPSTRDDLGVTGIWLMPIFPSPSSHGYDTTDYRSVNPDYGTTDDLRELLTQAHRRGVAVILDL
jgi:alpha-amylase